jgi:HNH endonuclease
MKSSLVYGDGHDEGTQERRHAGANRSILPTTAVRVGPFSAKCWMTMDRQVTSGFYAPAAHPSSDISKYKETRIPTTPPMRPTSKNAKKFACENRFGVPVSFAFWYEQRGLCPVCNLKITRITGWRLHYCVSRTMGSSTSAENCLLLHPECHDRVHCLRLSVSKPRLLPRGVRSA